MQSLTHSFTQIGAVAPSFDSCRRVLHVVNGEYFAGAERVQDLLALHLPDQGFETGFVCVKPDQFPLKRKSNSALESVGLSNPWSRQAIRQIAELARDGGYHLLHSHTPRSAWAALGAGEATGLPVVHTMHDLFLSQSSGPLRYAFNRYTIARLRKADLVTTVSPETQRLAESLGLGRKQTMILNGVPTARGEFVRCQPASTWTLGTVCLIRPCKGIEVLLRATADLVQRGTPVRCVVVGTFYRQEYETEIMTLVRDLKISDHVDFVGFSSNVSEHLENMDLFVMPSVGPEGLPMVLIEAMAHALPSIGSRVAGIADILREGTDGMLFTPGDHQELAARIDDFVAEKLAWKMMSENARRRHRDEFSADRMARDFADVYREVLA